MKQTSRINELKAQITDNLARQHTLKDGAEKEQLQHGLIDLLMALVSAQSDRISYLEIRLEENEANIPGLDDLNELVDAGRRVLNTDTDD